MGLCLATVLALAAAAHAQPFTPHIGYAYPAGGQQGATFEVTIGGQFLDDIAEVYVTGAGVKAELVEHVKPMTQEEFNQLRERLEELLKQPRDAGTLKELIEIRKKMASFVGRPSSPAIADTATIRVTIAADAAPGRRELRVSTPAGLSNPLLFCVGQLPEFSKKASKIIEDLRDFRALRNGEAPRSTQYTLPVNITLPTVVNGQMLPGAVDRYRFTANKGQHLVIAVCARELMPYIADAVPGWFQAAVTLKDSDGHELAYADHFRFHPDPVLYYEVPREGEYVLEVRDSLYRGREDFVYRISIGELPYITGVFPLGGQAGKQTAVELMGWNLPSGSITQNSAGKGPGVYPLSVSKGNQPSNSVSFAVDALPEVPAGASNHSPKDAQPIALPVIVNGRVERAGQWQVFRFDGRAGDEIVAEVDARRLGSPLDSVLRVTDAGGKELAYNDDHEDKGAGLDTQYADSCLRAKLPAGGTYYLYLGDIQQQGGPEYAYRLRVSSPRPDYELRVTPSSVNLRRGGSVPITVYALRKDGFSGAIELSLKDAPEGYTLSGARLPAQQDQVTLTLTAPAFAREEPVTFSLEGRAEICGREVFRKAVPADDMMQAFAYRHLVAAQELEAAISARFPARAKIQLISATPIQIAAGKTARVLVGVPQEAPLGRIQLELSDPPEGISLQGVSPMGRGSEIILQSDAAKVKPGLKGNLIVNVYMTPKNLSTAPANRPMNQRRISLGTLPAIPFEIVFGDRLTQP